MSRHPAARAVSSCGLHSDAATAQRAHRLVRVDVSRRKRALRRVHGVGQPWLLPLLRANVALRGESDGYQCWSSGGCKCSASRARLGQHVLRQRLLRQQQHLTCARRGRQASGARTSDGAARDGRTAGQMAHFHGGPVTSTASSASASSSSSSSSSSEMSSTRAARRQARSVRRKNCRRRRKPRTRRACPACGRRTCPAPPPTRRRCLRNVRQASV